MTNISTSSSAMMFATTHRSPSTSGTPPPSNRFTSCTQTSHVLYADFFVLDSWCVMLPSTAALSSSGQSQVHAGFDPSLDVTEQAVARAMDLDDVAEVLVQQVEAGGDYLIFKPFTRRHPFSHQLGQSFLLSVVKGKVRALVVKLTMGSGPAVVAVYLDEGVQVPDILNRFESKLHRSRKYLGASDISSVRQLLPAAIPENVLSAMREH